MILGVVVIVAVVTGGGTGHLPGTPPALGSHAISREGGQFFLLQAWMGVSCGLGDRAVPWL